MFSIVAIFFYTFSLALAQFLSYKIVPDIIPTKPGELLQLSFKNKPYLDKVTALVPDDLKLQPIPLWKAKLGAFYTLFMFDLGVDPTISPILNWLVLNIPGTNVSDGEVIGSYLSPTRYSVDKNYVVGLVVCMQQKKIDLSKEKKIHDTERFKYSFKKLFQKYKLGNPVAGIVLNVSSTDKRDNTIISFKKANIVPNYISTEPKEFLQITYLPEHQLPTGVIFNAELPVKTIRNPPLLFWKAKPDHFYTVIMADIDVDVAYKPSKLLW